MTSDDAIGELRRHSGSQFDPELADAFIGLVQSQHLGN
jgi:HD-GYP domain-containing protein (c-di-GMP phosphodiesterase class II)